MKFRKQLFSVIFVIAMLLVTFSVFMPAASAAGTDGDFDVERDFLYKTYTCKITINKHREIDFELPYRLHLPKNYDSSKEYPMLLHLHGAGSIGDDNKAQLNAGLMIPFSNPNNPIHDCIVVAPQCPSGSKWVEVASWADSQYSTKTIEESLPLRAAYSLLEHLKTEYSVDEDRVYASGISMGGYGTWDLLVRHTDTFAAAIPICGGADYRFAEKLVDLPIWTFHGTDDPTVPIAGTQKMYSEITKLGGRNIKFTVYEGASHNIWDSAFSEAGLIEWLLSQNRSDRIKPEGDDTTTVVDDETTSQAPEDVTVSQEPDDDITTPSDVDMSDTVADKTSGTVTNGGGKAPIVLWIGISAAVVAVIVLVCIIFIKKK